MAMSILPSSVPGGQFRGGAKFENLVWIYEVFVPGFDDHFSKSLKDLEHDLDSSWSV